MSVAFLVPELAHVSGGSRYNDAVLDAWPTTPPPTRVALASADDLPDGCRRADVAIVDGLLGCRNPEALARARADGRRVVVLVHMPQPEPPGAVGATATLAQEAAALRAADVVVATSQHTATLLRTRCPEAELVVATPGVDPRPLAPEHVVPTLLCVASVGPLKNQALVLGAAARCADLDFRVRFVGPVVDDSYAAQCRAAADDSLAGRVEWTGPLAGSALEAAYLGADLAFSVAFAEAYGMTVIEALAHGLPVVVGRGTGAVEALTAGGGTPGAQVFTNRPDEAGDLLRRWLTEPELRARWRRSAVGARPHLPRWSEAAARIAEVCARLGG